jgi:tRNA (guanine6-N2)-methyltransferase
VRGDVPYNGAHGGHYDEETEMARDFAPSINVELEIAEGLEDIARRELVGAYRERLVSRPEVSDGAIRFRYDGNPGGLLALRTVNAVYAVQSYDIPRPKAFLGQEHFTRLTEQIQDAMAVVGNDKYASLTINAAGSNSSVMTRLREELATANHLRPEPYDGDLTLRLRRSVGRKNSGWDALVRLSPRPNATRDWRVVNVPGALDAAVAHAMVLLSDPRPDEVVMNVASGSGSIAIERALAGGASAIWACDTDPEMLEAAAKNIEAAGVSEQIEVRSWDAGEIPMGTGSVDKLFADLPFGNRVGSHQDNRELYPAAFKEAARLVKKGGLFIAITHEIKLTEAVLLAVKKWEIERELRVALSGLHPRIYVLRRI